MKVIEKQVTQLTIVGAGRATGLGEIDPIDVILEDHGPARGQITINVFGEAWSHYWPAMGDFGIESFVAKVSTHYLANKLRRPDEKFTEIDGDELVAKMKHGVITDRRDKQIDEREARELWEEIEAFASDERWGSIGESEAELLHKTLGDDWWECMSERTSSHGQYVLDICAAVQQVLGERVAKVAA
ncbi:hypothetical protein [Salinicola acroporae]|uniref:Uncharacterized protein n=1 Tax=Salinicola acroporae TaxID=1541440 RepID=A0ABT6I426_9GAMM|nr:hypothetical protein [Salinicola acroporae]MDH4572434.1 hypothetical protein [Salinicola acroporae]